MHQKQTKDSLALFYAAVRNSLVNLAVGHILHFIAPLLELEKSDPSLLKHRYPLAQKESFI
jgi:hypothetical protein